MSGTSATDPGNRSSAQIEREVEATRAGLTNTLDELRDRVAPGQLFEQALDYARSSGGGEMMRNLGQAVRDNPLPLLLIGAGIGWMMLSGGNRPATNTYPGAIPAFPPPSDRRTRVYGTDDANSGGPSVTERVSGSASAMAGGVRDSVTSAANRTTEMASSAYGSVSSAAGSVAESVRDMASSTADRLSAGGHATRERMGHLSEGAGQGVGWLVREQPLVLGAIGVALGAALGALLPSTETENRLMGETRDATLDRGREMAREGYEQAKESAGRHVADAKSALGEVVQQTKDEMGGTSGPGSDSVAKAGDALVDAARKIRETTRDAAHNVASDARGAMGSDAAGGHDATKRGNMPRPG